ncbi:MAG: 2'-5' RNA ligase family protein [Vulcanococcus sp.]
MTLIAINVLLDPDAATVERARAVNARLRQNEPRGFALDADHAPHITLVQAFVRQADVEAVAGALRNAVQSEPTHTWQSTATGFYHLADGERGLMGIVIQSTEDLRRLQRCALDTLAPFLVAEGSAAAFAPRPDGQPLSAATLDYVSHFAASRTGERYHPHLTVGLDSLDFITALEAEPFEPFPVRAVGLSLYQLGEYGVAQVKLHELLRC